MIKQFREQVLDPMRQQFVDKDEIIELMGIALFARENLFMLGPPGTAKSALVNSMGRLIHGKTFDYLLTRFSEPNEIFGPYDIRKLRDGDLETNTEGMLPEADLVFLDEIFNANSSILNSLLGVLNERVFRRGREVFKLNTLSVFSASNRLPEDDTLKALYDRFLIRVNCGLVEDENLGSVLNAGWKMETTQETQQGVSSEDIRKMQKEVLKVNLDPIMNNYRDLILRCRQAGLEVSDRRAVKLLKLVASSAYICGRMEAKTSDLWVIRHSWERPEQKEILSGLVNEWIHQEEQELDDHFLAQDQHISAEHLLQNLENIEKELINDHEHPQVYKDQLFAISVRLPWVGNTNSREQLQTKIDELWKKLD